MNLYTDGRHDNDPYPTPAPKGRRGRETLSKGCDG